jgi:hypothetical protein
MPFVDPDFGSPSDRAAAENLYKTLAEKDFFRERAAVRPLLLARAGESWWLAPSERRSP